MDLRSGVVTRGKEAGRYAVLERDDNDGTLHLWLLVEEPGSAPNDGWDVFLNEMSELQELEEEHGIVWSVPSDPDRALE